MKVQQKFAHGSARSRRPGAVSAPWVMAGAIIFLFGSAILALQFEPSPGDEVADEDDPTAQLNSEMDDFVTTFGSLNQSYRVPGVRSNHGASGGSLFIDEDDLPEEADVSLVEVISMPAAEAIENTAQLGRAFEEAFPPGTEAPKVVVQQGSELMQLIRNLDQGDIGVLLANGQDGDDFGIPNGDDEFDRVTAADVSAADVQFEDLEILFLPGTWTNDETLPRAFLSRGAKVVIVPRQKTAPALFLPFFREFMSRMAQKQSLEVAFKGAKQRALALNLTNSDREQLNSLVLLAAPGVDTTAANPLGRAEPVAAESGGN